MNKNNKKMGPITKKIKNLLDNNNIDDIKQHIDEINSMEESLLNRAYETGFSDYELKKKKKNNYFAYYYDMKKLYNIKK